MRLASISRAVIVSVSLLTVMFVPVTASHAAVKCAVTVLPGGDMQAALDAAPASSTICVSSGTYTISATLLPKFRQTISGLSRSSMPVIMCPPPIIFCIDGSLGPEKVRLTRLVFDGARAADIRTGTGWKLTEIEARNAGAGGSTSGVGIVVNGSKVAITHSYVHDNWQFGIRAVNATNLTLKQTEVAFNPTDPVATAGFSGGVKFNGVVGLIAMKNYVHDNGGGAGIWLDVDSQNFQLVSNRVFDNAKDEIRVETSCYGSAGIQCRERWEQRGDRPVQRARRHSGNERRHFARRGSVRGPHAQQRTNRHRWDRRLSHRRCVPECEQPGRVELDNVGRPCNDRGHRQ